MKKRADILIYMEILNILSQGEKGPTRLAQASNLNYAVMMRYVAPLEANGLLVKSVKDDHETYSLTPEGFRFRTEWKRFWGGLKVPLI